MLVQQPWSRLAAIFFFVSALGFNPLSAAPKPPPPAAPVDRMVWPAWQFPAGKVDPKGGLSIEPDEAAESIRPAAAAKAERAAAAKAGIKVDDKQAEPKDEPVALVQRVI